MDIGYGTQCRSPSPLRLDSLNSSGTDDALSSPEAVLAKYQLKVESETSMGVVSAFLGGFAINMVNEYHPETFESNPARGSTYMVLLVIAVGCNLGAVLSDAAVSSAGLGVASLDSCQGFIADRALVPFVYHSTPNQVRNA